MTTNQTTAVAMQYIVGNVYWGKKEVEENYAQFPVDEVEYI